MSETSAAAVTICHPGQCCDGWCVEVASVEVHGLPAQDEARIVGEALLLADGGARAEVRADYRNLLDEYAASVNPAPYTSERALYERLRHLTYDPPPTEAVVAVRDERGVR